jgi:peroxin-3
MNFLSRHKNKFAWIGGTIAIGYGLVEYAKYKWTEMITERSLEMSSRSNLKYRFELVLKDCQFVVESLLIGLKDNIFQELNVELLTTQLKMKQGDSNSLLEESKKQKREMWNELKIQSFCRVLSSMYLLNLLTVLTTVKLSLLGRMIYLDSVQDQDVKTVSEETERQYLTLSWYLLNVGWKDCVARVRQAAEKQLKSVPLTLAMTHDTLMELVSNIRKEVEFEHGLEFKFDIFLLPKEGSESLIFSQAGIKETTVDPPLLQLINETRDVVESLDFGRVLRSGMDELETVFRDEMQSMFFEKAKPQKAISFEAGDGDPIEITSKSIPIAGILPVMAKVAHQITSRTPNPYLQVFLINKSNCNHLKLKTFGSIIYGGWE